MRFPRLRRTAAKEDVTVVSLDSSVWMSSFVLDPLLGFVVASGEIVAGMPAVAPVVVAVEPVFSIAL